MITPNQINIEISSFLKVLDIVSGDKIKDALKELFILWFTGQYREG